MFDELHADRGLVVPLVGSGLTIEAGAPSGPALALELARRADRSDLAEHDLFDVADALEAERTTGWVQRAVAEIVGGTSLRATPALAALARCPSRLIATTNYDHGVQLGIEAAGLVPRTFTWADFDEALSPPSDGTVHVIHLHGVASEPSSIVLTEKSYEAATVSDQLQHALKTVASSYRLLLLGQSLSEREGDLREAFAWAVNTWDGPPDHRLLLRADAIRPGFIKDLLDAGIVVVGAEDSTGDYDFVRKACRLLGGSAGLRSDRPMTPLSAVDRDPVHVPMVAAPASEVETETDRIVYTYGPAFGRPLNTLTDLDAGRILVIGRPGHGKTQALMHMSVVTHFGVFRSLATVVPPAEGEDGDMVFVNWMRDARALGPDTPTFTADGLRADSWTICLDGFDEVPFDLQPRVAAFIEQLSLEHPQHRWVVSTRPLPNVADRFSAFEAVHLLCGLGWQHEYGEKRGFAAGKLDEAFRGLGNVSDLMRVPLYVAAGYDALDRDEPLPQTPLELLSLLADKGFEQDIPRLRLDIPSTRRWLQRLALAMRSTGRAEVERAEVMSDTLFEGLAIDPHPGIVDRLVVRTLLAESGSDVRFPAEHLLDARAANALVGLGPEAPDLMVGTGLVEVDGERTVLPSWRYLLSLLCAAKPDLLGIVGSYDELIGPSTLASTAPERERTSAIRTIWAWYCDRRVWIPRTEESHLRSDEEIVKSLGAGGIASDLVKEIAADAQHDEHTRRGNAVAMLLALGQEGALRPLLARLIQDSNAVVRRRATAAAVDLKLEELVPVMQEQLHHEGDNLASEALATAIVSLAPEDDLASIVSGLRQRDLRRLQGAIAERWNREQQLAYLASQESPDEMWLEEIISNDPAPWSAEEVALLASALTVAADYRLLGMAQSRILDQHPRAALNAMFRQPTPGYLDRLLRSLVQRVSEGLSGAEPEGAPPIAHSRAPTQPPPTIDPDLANRIESGDWNFLVERKASHDDVEGLGEAYVNGLDAAIDYLLDVVRAYSGSVVGSIVRTEGGWDYDDERGRSEWNLLSWAATRQRPLDLASWLRVAGLDLYASWMHATFDGTWGETVASTASAASALTAEGILNAIPGDLPPEVARVVVRIRGLGANSSAALRRCLFSLADAGDRAAIEAQRGMLDDRLLDEALVRLGDDDAEQRLLRRIVGPRDLPSDLPERDASSWVGYVRKESSLALLEEVIRRLMRADVPTHELRSLLDAMERCARPNALAAYDRLMSDPEHPDSSFLWYERQGYLDRLATEAVLGGAHSSISSAAERIVVAERRSKEHG